KLAAASARNGYRETARPKALDLHMGNLCNLKCRMCHGQSSSAIAADPVHSRWAPSGVGPARWRAGEAVIAPEPVLGVESAGIGLDEVRLRRKDARTTAVSFSRFDAGAEWWREKDFLYGELLKDSKDLQAIHLIGGEPLLIKEVREVMRFLADNGSAPNIG